MWKPRFVRWVGARIEKVYNVEGPYACTVPPVWLELPDKVFKQESLIWPL